MNRFRLKTTTEAADIVSSIGGSWCRRGRDKEDKVPLTAADKEQMFVDILPETEVDDGVAYLSFIWIPRWIEQRWNQPPANVKQELEKINMSEFMDLGECTIRAEDIDWVNN